MKKLLIGLLAAVSLNAVAATAERAKTNPEFIESGRIYVSNMTGLVDYIITDTKTGCQYLSISGRAATPLGCFDEYKKDTKKK